MAHSNTLVRQIVWASKAFGPHFRWQGILDHLRKETAEIEAKPTDLEEWIDAAILSFDGGWRLIADQFPFLNCEEVVEIWEKAYAAKIAKNEQREWPDWRTADPAKAIEHVRTVQDGKGTGAIEDAYFG